MVIFNNFVMKGIKMKRILFLLMAVIVVFGLGTTANAYTLEVRGTDTLGNRLIYDPDLNITWYDFSKAPAIWANQVTWADTLSVTFGSKFMMTGDCRQRWMDQLCLAFDGYNNSRL